MEEFIRSTTGQILIFLTGISGWVVAIYAAFIQKKSYDMQLDSDKAYEEILNRAKNDWEGKYTKEQVEALKIELSYLKNEIEKNRNDIPIKAKEVFLKDQLFTLNSNLEELYSQRTNVVKEIEKIEVKGQNLGIDDNINKEVEALLKPIYIKKQTQEKTNKIAIYSILLITSIIVLPYLIHLLNLRVNLDGFYLGRGEGLPLYAIVAIVFTFIIGVFLSYRKKISNQGMIKKYSIGFNLILLIQFVLSFCGFFFGCLVLSESINYDYIESEIDVVVISLIIIMMSSLCFGYMVQIWKILNKE